MATAYSESPKTDFFSRHRIAIASVLLFRYLLSTELVQSRIFLEFFTFHNNPENAVFRKSLSTASHTSRFFFFAGSSEQPAITITIQLRRTAKIASNFLQTAHEQENQKIGNALNPYPVRTDQNGLRIVSGI